jgi:hypothetical protein
MRVVLRIVAFLAVALFVIGFVRHQPWQVFTSNQTPHGSSNTDLPRDSQATFPESADTRPSRTDAANSTSEIASSDDLGGSSPMPQSAMVRALSSVVSQNSDVFGDADSELQESLVQADQILTESRTSARQALRNVNRQVRLPGRSPHLLLVVVDGLATSDLACYGGSAATPACDHLARQGLKATRFQSLASTRRDGTIQSTSGLVNSAFIETLWNSGYSPALLGDLSAASAQQGSMPWDQTLGWTSSTKASKAPFAPFPTHVISRTQTLGVTQSPDQSPGTSFDQIVRDEAISYLRSVQARRPAALVVAMPMEWWKALAQLESPANDDDLIRQQALAHFDRFLGDLHTSLIREAGATRLITIVAGVAPASTTHDDSSPLLASWPNRIPAGQVLEKPFRATDLAATITEMIQSTRRTRGDSGRSVWSDWQ